VIASLKPRVQGIVTSLIDNVEDKRSMELVADFAYPLPVTVIAEMLGVPVEDHPVFRDWSSQMTAAIDPRPTMSISVRAARAYDKFDAYFQRLIDERRRAPRDDLLTALVKARDEKEHLTEKEVLLACSLLLVAGHETTMNLISNGLLALLRNRDQLEKLKQDPSLFRNGIEELLRYDSPVVLAYRTALDDVTLAGTSLRKGQDVVLVTGAANRDPARFKDPDRLDITRQPNHHLAFSSGIHSCLGAPLARLESRLALEELFRRLPDLELDGEPEWRETITVRGPKTLHLRF
jgi:cytochrome P450